MFETIANFFKKLKKSEKQEGTNSKTMAKERLHLVLMQDRANVSADFLELMKQEIIEVIKKYIEVEEEAIDVRLTNKVKEDGTTGAPFLYANIPIMNIKNDVEVDETKKENTKTTINKENTEEKNVKKSEEKENIENSENKKAEKDEKEIDISEKKDIKQEEIKEDKEKEEIIEESKEDTSNKSKEEKKEEDK